MQEYLKIQCYLVFFFLTCTHGSYVSRWCCSLPSHRLLLMSHLMTSPELYCWRCLNQLHAEWQLRSSGHSVFECPLCLQGQNYSDPDCKCWVSSLYHSVKVARCAEVEKLAGLARYYSVMALSKIIIIILSKWKYDVLFLKEVVAHNYNFS